MLKNSRCLRWIIVFPLGVFILAIWLQIGIELSLIPPAGEICNKSEQTGQIECATYYIPFVILWHIYKFFDASVITAIATAFIGFFTYTLYKSTDALVSASSRQDEAMRNSLRISRQMADAARDNADASVKAEMPILFPLIIAAHDLLPPNVLSVQPHIAQLRFVLENHGKTPAIIKKIACQLCLSCELPEIPHWDHPNIRLDNEVIPGQTRYSPVQSSFPCVSNKPLTGNQIMDARRPSEDNAYKRFYFFGYVIYDDVFGYQHIRGFGRKVFPTGNVGVPIQPVRGGDKYNYYHRIDRRTNEPA